ncbi:MAG: hypothetical protein JWN79_1477 [Gemmatimonadetes bacterium]|jgi:hypothetical protein|nr:hypothetical protein [Gemmatimonadota bacterium]
MRYFLLALLAVAAPTCGSERVRIERDQSPPQTTFSALRALYGADSIATCRLPDAAPAPGATTFTTPDKGFALDLPAGWVVRPPVEEGSGGVAWIWAGPDTSRVRITRVTRGGIGPGFLTQSGTTTIVPALECASSSGESGVVWRLHDPGFGGLPADALFLGMAEAITSTGRRYKFSIQGRTKTEQERLARMVTDAVVHPPR